MGQIIYYPPGYIPTAPEQNMSAQWNDSTQTVTTWDINGNVTSTRSYTAAEVAAAEAAAAAQNIQANTATIEANIVSQLATIEAWISANPSGATLTAAQTLVLARMMAGFARILLGLTSTVGGS